MRKNSQEKRATAERKVREWANKSEANYQRYRWWRDHCSMTYCDIMDYVAGMGYK
jgi:hypothetical protein